jgi:hypothetical protein
VTHSWKGAARRVVDAGRGGYAAPIPEPHGLRSRSGSFSPAFELGGQEEDRMSVGERVTWETCPRCGLSAAVRWCDGGLVAVDCPGGCRLTAADFARRKAKGLRFRPPVPPEPTVGEVARVAAGATRSALRSDR